MIFHGTKKMLAASLAVMTVVATATGCQNNQPAPVQTGNSTPIVQPQNAEITSPKYVFLFIGDGMSFPQFQLASNYLGAMENKSDLVKGGKQLSFMQFPTIGTATTFDSTSFCPDSASTATSIATGKKTHSGVVNMDETKTKKYETIAEQLKAEKNFKIGVVSSVNLNHATPAAFYAHQPTRGNYYEIGKEMVESNFDYFAGGALLQPTGKEKDQEDIYETAEKAGYRVIKTQAEAEKLTAADGKALVISEQLADSDAMPYDNDRQQNEWALSDYVKKGIEVLDGDQGFFMMVEGGKIDWACHANDSGSTIADTLALDQAVAEAVKFYQQHPDETLILVTGDHETGGLSIGYAGTDYDTFLTNLSNQKISYAKFDSDYVSQYVENKTPFTQAMADVEELFGLVTPENATKAKSETLVLNDYEMEQLKVAYDRSLAGTKAESQQDRLLYGSYNPFSVTVTHLLNNKSGINFASYSHTGIPVAVFAQGQGASAFEGYYDNTDIYKQMAELLGL